MLPFSFFLETILLLVIGSVTAFAWFQGRRSGLRKDRGWIFIETGLLLLLLGAIVDLSDHFPELSRFVVLGRTRGQSLLEKGVGHLGGFVFLAIGLWRWLPHVVNRRRAEAELRQAHEDLELRVRERTAELSLRSQELQREVVQRERAQHDLATAKKMAEDASTAKSHFLANMSHELRSPLNSVIGFANVLLKNREGNLGPEDLRYLGRIRANGEHLLSLINEILDLAKIESGRLTVSLAPANLGELVRETIGQLRGQLAGRDVRLAARLPRFAEAIETDEVKLRQVLINLLSNAIKFTPRGEVTVVLWCHPQTGKPRCLEVQDTGVGIPPDRLEAIFDAFQQADSGTARHFGGTGLGLSISRSLCELMGYSLGVESEVGRGSTFRIDLAPGSGPCPRIGELELIDTGPIPIVTDRPAGEP